VDKIISTHRERVDVARYARAVQIAEIVENDFNLNMPRYIEAPEEVDIAAVQKKIDALEAELAGFRVKMREHLRELGIDVGHSPFHTHRHPAMSSFSPAVLDNLRFAHDVISAIRAIGEGKGKQDLFKERAPELLENLRQVAIVESTESSNRLEGITLPRTAIEVLVRRNKEPQPGNRSEGEIADYRNVLQLIHERHEYMEPTPNLVLQLHRDLFRFSGTTNAGQWKMTDNLITERRPDGSRFVRFSPTPAWRTAEAIDELHRAFAAAGDSEVDALILVALYLLDFLCIHPFSDGNGRMVRLLTVLLLYRESTRLRATFRSSG
jgi:Fic family protein